MSFGIPVAYYDGIRVRPETYNVVKVIKNKLLCISEEIDFFLDTIIRVIQQIKDNGGFTDKKITYTLVLMECYLTIYDINSDKNVDVLKTHILGNNVCQTVDIIKEYQIYEKK